MLTSHYRARPVDVQRRRSRTVRRRRGAHVRALRAGSAPRAPRAARAAGAARVARVPRAGRAGAARPHWGPRRRRTARGGAQSRGSAGSRIATPPHCHRCDRGIVWKETINIMILS